MNPAKRLQNFLFRDHRHNSTKITAILFGTLIILATIPLTVFLSKQSEEVTKNPKAAATRDPFKQPFSSDSPWNMPIGSGAQYVDGQINMTGKWQDVEGELVFINAAAPLRTLYAGTTSGGEQWWNYPAGGGGPSCSTSLANKGQVHVEDNYIVPDPVNGGEDGTLPNRGGGALKTDNRTIQEFQYSTRCTATGPVSAGAVRTTYDIYGKGIPTNGSTTSPEGYGAHGGSGLSAVGGDLRKWEIADTGPIKHALKMTVNVGVLSKCNGGYRWPAITADAGYSTVGGDNEYFGPVCDLRMGSLTAIHPTVNCQTFVTTALGKRICQALQDYGAYIVDTGPRNWGAMTILGEYGTASTMNSAGSDIVKMFDNLFVIANNSSTSVGGGGTPRVALADPLCPTNPCSGTTDSPPTVSITSPSNGVTITTTSQNITVTAADDVGVSKVDFYVDSVLKTSTTTTPFSYSWNTTGLTGSHTIFAKATDTSNQTTQSSIITVTVTLGGTNPPPSGDEVNTIALVLNDMTANHDGTICGTSGYDWEKHAANQGGVPGSGFNRGTGWGVANWDCTAGSTANVVYETRNIKAYVYNGTWTQITDHIGWCDTMNPQTNVFMGPGCGGLGPTFNMPNGSYALHWASDHNLLSSGVQCSFTTYQARISGAGAATAFLMADAGFDYWNDNATSIDASFVGRYRRLTTNWLNINGTSCSATTIQNNPPPGLSSGTVGKIGDINSDGVVNIIDISKIIDKWGATNKPVEDVNQDGWVNILDISLAIDHWG